MHKNNIVKALIGKFITTYNNVVIKESEGIVYLDSHVVSNKDTHVSNFKRHNNTSINNFTQILYEDKRDLIYLVTSMTMSQKVHLLESAILSNNEIIKLFFEKSFEYINGKYYHILLYM